MTILEATVEVLKTAGRPLTAREVLDEIQSRGLYEFGAKDPLKVLSGTIRQDVRKGNPPRVVEAERGRYRLG